MAPRGAAAVGALAAVALLRPCAGQSEDEGGDEGELPPAPDGHVWAPSGDAIHQFLAKPQGLRDHVLNLHSEEWADWSWDQRVDAIEKFEDSSKRGQKGADPRAGTGWYYFNENTGASTYTRPAQLGHPDPRHGNRLYWIDPDSGEAVWQMPVQWDWEKKVDGDRVYYWNRQTGESAWQRSDDAAWSRIEKPHYWWNEVTNETSAERPAALGHVDAHHPGTVYWVIPGTDKAVWEKPKEYDWHVQKDIQNGQEKEYYYNAQTQETVWEKPAVLGWKRLSREDKFWYNEVTKKSQWERPEEMGMMSKDPEHKGNVYWVDPGSKQATWKKPALWDWKAKKADDDKAKLMGRTHYYYSRGGKAQWEKPECMGWHEIPVQHTEIETVVSPASDLAMPPQPPPDYTGADL